RRDADRRARGAGAARAPFLRRPGRTADARERDVLLVLEQGLNGLQYGVMLFLMAAGLTLIFGIMNLVNLPHGCLDMVRACLALVILVGGAAAGFLYALVTSRRLGMLIRAGASNRTMVAALGVNIRRLYTLVFGLGAALAGLAGLMAGPIYAVQPGMGEQILIQVFVVIIIGGIGSIRGAVAGAVVVGMVDTVGRAFLRPTLSTIVSDAAAAKAGPAPAAMLIYLMMAAVLLFR